MATRWFHQTIFILYALGHPSAMKTPFHTNMFSRSCVSALVLCLIQAFTIEPASSTVLMLQFLLPVPNTIRHLLSTLTTVVLSVSVYNSDTFPIFLTPVATSYKVNYSDLLHFYQLVLPAEAKCSSTNNVTSIWSNSDSYMPCRAMAHNRK
ncbi:hypothetical protein EV361DRAFT_520943 [Lentinula raphanica]|nr:hypothetical protein EV361DRAFT_520943 [Lentinula raphanica]